MNKTVKKVGKPDMYQSQKRELKKKEYVKPIPDEEQDQLDYLGVKIDQLAE